MSLPRSTFYDKPATPADEVEIVDLTRGEGGKRRDV